MNNERLQWFRARVGKTVWRMGKKVGSPHPVVVDSVNADVMFRIEESEILDIMYFDTPEEVIEHEKTLKG